MFNFYIPHSENIYTFQNAKNYITVAKTCEKFLRLNMASTTKVKVIVEKSYNITVIGFNFGRHKDLSTFKSDIHFGLSTS